MSDQKTDQMTGAEIVIKALKDQGVEHIFGYPGGAVLPIYDEIFKQKTAYEIGVRLVGSEMCIRDSSHLA